MEVLQNVITLLAAFAAGGVIGYLFFIGLEFGVEVVVDWFSSRRRRIARIEADLNRAEKELQEAVLLLATEIAADREKASQELAQAALRSQDSSV